MIYDFYVYVLPWGCMILAIFFEFPQFSNLFECHVYTMTYGINWIVY